MAPPLDNHAPRSPIGRRRRWLWRVAIGAVLVFGAAAVAMHEHVVRSARAAIFTMATVPPADCIVVPGARIFPDGRPYPLLADRLAMALAVWRAGKAPRILLSGLGGGSRDEDEVAAMRTWLRDSGVPASALLDDPLGLRTLDTMRRCASEFGMRSAIVVTNPFHLPRCVFLGTQCGLVVHGVEAPYGSDYSTATMWKNQGREVLARVLAWLDAFVLDVV